MAALKAEGRVVEGVRMVMVNGRQSEALEGMLIFPFTVPHDAREPVQFVLSDGDRRLGVLTDIGAPTAHVAQVLSGLDALVLEANYDRELRSEERRVGKGCRSGRAQGGEEPESDNGS